MRRYKKIQKEIFTNGIYALVPVRDSDKYAIMKWRNGQIGVLRQAQPLTEAQQENYFKTVIDKLFEEDQPSQFIFSFLENGILIGYGGLVHIDWKNRTAEISFLTETSRNHSKEIFISDWKNYLSLIRQVADGYLNFNSIFTYAYDIRPALYAALESSGFNETQRLNDLVTINNEKKDVVIHTLFLNPLKMRLADKADVDLYFKWTNDQEVRKFSFQQEEIPYEDHVIWFNSRVNDPDFRFYIFYDKGNLPVGQVRINKSKNGSVVGISIAAEHRGMSYGHKMLIMACENYFKGTHEKAINAYIKSGNPASLAIFKKAGFTEQERLKVGNSDSFRLIVQHEQL